MEITFGMHLDGADWSRKEATLGEVRTGPAGMLGILETRLGLGGRDTHAVHRINAMMKRIEEQDAPERWYHRSYQEDPWSTAKKLLALRDELTAAGWRGAKLGASPRLEALSQLEQAETALPPGHGDRLLEAIDTIESGRPAGLERIRLLEPLDTLPPLWQRLLTLLEKQGSKLLEEPPTLEENPPRDNLHILQNILQNGTAAAAHSERNQLQYADESLILLSAANEWEAAEHLALWLAADKEANGNIAILCGRDTFLLDQALARQGLQRIGSSQTSRWREAWQLLPLLLALVWKPVDIKLVVELLSIGSLPLPEEAVYRLLGAISSEPGVGGSAWKEAKKKIQEKLKDQGSDPGDTLSRIVWIFEESNWDSREGIPEEALRLRLDRIITILKEDAGRSNIAAEITPQAEELKLLSIGKGSIPRIALERMLDSLIGGGSEAPDSIREAAPWIVVNHPGQLVDKIDEVIWWGFDDPMEGAPEYWSRIEREELERAGVLLEEARDNRLRQARAWEQAFLKVGERFLALHIGSIAGEDVAHHPFWDILCQKAAAGISGLTTDQLEAALIRDCSFYTGKPVWSFAGRTMKLVPAPSFPMDEPATILEVEPGSISKPASLSYSQMKTLIGCPLNWALERHAGLKPALSQEIPTGNQMVGTFSHKIVEELYKYPGAPLDAETACQEAGRLYDELLPSMAAELQQEGATVENRRYRKAAADTIHYMVKTINELGFKVTHAEKKLKSELDGVPFTGYADLLLEDRNGRQFVLDMKWTSKDKYYIEDLQEGRALQLAAYAWMLKPDGMDQVNASYYMLAQKRFITDSPLFGEDALEAPYSMEELWRRAVESYRDVQEQFRQGLIEVRGLEQKIDQEENNLDWNKATVKYTEECHARGRLYQSPPCSFCHFQVLCGYKGGNA